MILNVINYDFGISAVNFFYILKYNRIHESITHLLKFNLFSASFERDRSKVIYRLFSLLFFFHQNVFKVLRAQFFCRLTSVLKIPSGRKNLLIDPVFSILVVFFSKFGELYWPP